MFDVKYSKRIDAFDRYLDSVSPSSHQLIPISEEMHISALKQEYLERFGPVPVESLVNLPYDAVFMPDVIVNEIIFDVLDKTVRK